MLTRQQIITALQTRGFIPLTSPETWGCGALRITVLDAPRAAVVSPQGTTYVAFASLQELEQQLTLLVAAQALT